jgi:hypothetical protein
VLTLATLALALVATAFLAIWRGSWWIAVFLACGVLSVLIASSAIGFAGETMLFAQFLVLLPIVGVLILLPRRVRKWLGVVVPLSITIALYVVFVRDAEKSYRRYLHLLELYPFESLEERVRVPDAGLRPPTLTDAAAMDLSEVEIFTDEADGRDGSEPRSPRRASVGRSKRWTSSASSATRSRLPTSRRISRGWRN